MSVDEERRISSNKIVFLQRNMSFFEERRLFGVCTDRSYIDF